MEFLKDTEHFGETFKKGEDDSLGADVEKFLGKLILWAENKVFNRISKRVNWILDRQKNGTFEITKSNNTTDVNGNWRFLINADVLEIQKKIAGTWTIIGKWSE